ncbi:hypothetical protein V1525DRAFT_409295 [Lipomyces kononenkoae]|uniref:Uncharacterized protein n=1 Tax=Lipomyces kononenkoae TaxID=34357 RepID=A0ACC3SW94_LIPKO
MASSTVRAPHQPCLDSSRTGKPSSRQSKMSSSSVMHNSHSPPATTELHNTQHPMLETDASNSEIGSSVPNPMRRTESSSSLFSLFKSMSIGHRQRRDSSVSTRSTATTATVDRQSSRLGLPSDNRNTMYRHAEKSGSSMSLFASSLFVPKMRASQTRDPVQQPTKASGLERRRKLAAGLIRRAATDQPQAHGYPHDKGHPVAQENPYKNVESVSIASVASSTSSRLRSISQKFSSSKRSSGFSTVSATDGSLTQKIKAKASSSLLHNSSRLQKTYGQSPTESDELARALYNIDDSLQVTQNKSHSSIQRSYPRVSQQQQTAYMQNSGVVHTPNMSSRKISAGSSVSATSSSTTSEFVDDSSSITTINSGTSTSPVLGLRSNRKVSGVSNKSSGSCNSIQPVGGVCWIGENGTALRAGRAWDSFGEDTDEDDDGGFYALKAAALSGSIRSRASNSETSKRFSNDGTASLRSSGQDWRFEREEETAGRVLVV